MSNIKGRKRNNLSFEIKKKMVNDHFEDGLTFSQLSKKYNISYSTARRNCLEYQIHGEKVLKQTSGNWTNHNRERSNSIDQKDKEIARLKKLVKEKELENEIIKKLQTLIQKEK